MLRQGPVAPSRPVSFFYAMSDAAELVSRLHGELLRCLSDRADIHFQGRRSAAAHFRRAGFLTTATAKKLGRIDDAFGICRHITRVSAKDFVTLVMDEVGPPSRDDGADGDADDDDADGNHDGSNGGNANHGGGSPPDCERDDDFPPGDDVSKPARPAADSELGPDNKRPRRFGEADMAAGPELFDIFSTDDFIEVGVQTNDDHAHAGRICCGTAVQTEHTISNMQVITDGPALVNCARDLALSGVCDTVRSKVSVITQALQDCPVVSNSVAAHASHEEDTNSGKVFDKPFEIFPVFVDLARRRVLIKHLLDAQRSAHEAMCENAFDEFGIATDLNWFTKFIDDDDNWPDCGNSVEEQA